MWGCKILCENLWWLWARQEQPILTLSANFARRGDSLLVVGRVATSTHSPPVRRRVNRGTSYLRAKCRLRRLRSETRLRAQRSALRLFFAPRFARLRGDSLLVVEQGCYLHPFAACSAAGEQRNILALRSGCFCTALCAIARR